MRIGAATPWRGRSGMPSKDPRCTVAICMESRLSSREDSGRGHPETLWRRDGMRLETPDGHDSVLDGVDIHTLISGTERMAETVTDVVDAEGSADVVSAADAPAFAAWL